MYTLWLATTGLPLVRSLRAALTCASMSHRTERASTEVGSKRSNALWTETRSRVVKSCLRRKGAAHATAELTVSLVEFEPLNGLFLPTFQHSLRGLFYKSRQSLKASSASLGGQDLLETLMRGFP